MKPRRQQGVVVRCALVAGLIATGAHFGPVTAADIVVRDAGPDAANTTGAMITSGHIMSLAVSSDGNRVYAGSWSGGLWRSDDGGSNWRQVSFDLPGDVRTSCVDQNTNTCTLPVLSIPDVVVSPENPDLLFAVATGDARDGKPRDGVYRSEDGGKTWARVFRFTGTKCDYYQLAFAPDDPTLLYAVGGCAIASSLPDAGRVGTKWTQTALASGASVQSIAVGPLELVRRTPGTLPTPFRRVYACGPAGLYYSTDSGQSFEPDVKGRTCTSNAWPDSRRYLAIPPNHPNELYKIEGGGSNGVIYFETPIVKPCSSSSGCTGALWLATYPASPDQPLGSAGGIWAQMPGPPSYSYNLAATNSGGYGVTTQPLAGGGHLVFFMEANYLSVAVGPPTTDGWHRLDGPDASTLCPNGESSPLCKPERVRRGPIHPDPHAFAITSGLTLSLKAGTSTDARFRHNTVIDSCGTGTLLLAGDGGVFRSDDCGETWARPAGLSTLWALSFGGLARADGSPPPLYFVTVHNDGYQSIDGGKTWGPQLGCGGDCDALWTDPLQPDLVLFITRGNGPWLFKGKDGAPHLRGENNGNLNKPCADFSIDGTCRIDIGYPPSFSSTKAGPVLLDDIRPAIGMIGYFWADLDRHNLGYRMVVYTVPGGSKEPWGDFVMVAPTERPADPANVPVPKVGSTLPQTVWRYRGSKGASWKPEGDGLARANLPEGATVLQASGGHDNPTYFVLDREPIGDNPLPTFETFFGAQNGNRLFRSHRDSTGMLDGWDCIVPGRPAGGDPAHTAACKSTPVRGAKNAGRAYFFATDPYDPRMLYVVDEDGVKVTIDGGDSWERDDALSAWITDSGQIHPDILPFSRDIARYELVSVEFSPNEPRTRFATGAAGVFYTVSAKQPDETALPALGVWHRLLDPAALPCVPRHTFFDHTGGRRNLYVGCLNRSLLRFDGIPSTEFDVKTDFKVPAVSSDRLREPVPVPPPEFPPKGPPGPVPNVQLGINQAATQHNCSSGEPLAAFSVVLDNSKSEADVLYRIQVLDRDARQQPWAQAQPASGMIRAGKAETVNVIPRRDLCRRGTRTVVYNALVEYRSADEKQQLAPTGTLLITETVVPAQATPP